MGLEFVVYMEKCDVCKKVLDEREEQRNIVWFTEIQYIFCNRHIREFRKMLKAERAKFPKSIREAKPCTKEWHKMCSMEEQVVKKYHKLALLSSASKPRFTKSRKRKK